LIEKPLSTSIDGVEDLAQLAATRKTTIAVAYVLRTNPALAAMRDAIRSGRFGDPVQLVFSAGQNFPFFRPAYRKTYYASRETGGGAIQDALTHGVNAAEWLIGPMTQVAADASHQVLEGVDVEDTAHVIARHSGVMASYSLNQHQAPNETTFTVVCTEGTLRCQLHRARWSWQVSPESHWTDGGYHPVERDEMFVAQVNMFLDSLEHQSRPLCTLEEGSQTLLANLAILRAADRRSWQSVGLEGELDG
jgi:predicted dehydrogenase